MPIVTLKSISDTKLGKSAAKEIQGVKLDGTPWKKSFFANDKKLRDQLEDFEVGDIVNVVMKQDGDYWNISGFKEVSDEEIEKATQSAKKYAKTSTESSSNNVRRSDGGSRGDDTNRSAAIYLAREMINMTMGADFTVTASPNELAIAACNLADKIIYPYIKDGKVPDDIPFDEEPRTKKYKRESADPKTED